METDGRTDRITISISRDKKSIIVGVVSVKIPTAGNLCDEILQCYRKKRSHLFCHTGNLCDTVDIYSDFNA